MNFTEEQIAAIKARGRTIVSASAGSGKTSVMIERCIALIEEGFDVRGMLAVTFTNKAASQMREKLRKNLQKRILSAEGEKKARLREQYERLPLADISTIHAFCGRLIRIYFYYLDVDPAFRIVSDEDAEGSALQARALSETLEEGYESGGESFGKLLTAYFRKKKDNKLRSSVLATYEKVRNLADYRAVLTELAEGKRNDFSAAAEYLAEDFRRRARSIAERAKTAFDYAEKNGFDGTEVCEEIRAAAEQMANAGDIFAMRKLPKPVLQRCPSEKKKDPLPRRYSAASIKALAAAVKDLYDEQKRDVTDENGNILVSYGRDAEYARYENAREQTCALARLVLRFDEVYFRLKQEAGLLDYGDLEHLALRLLTDPAHPEVLSAVRERYRCVFVDEYQDVNPLQEQIVSLVAGEDLFLVGDKKQAIYAFRGSRSRFFTDTEENFRNMEDANALQLNQNFRSSEAVLSAVNAVFQETISGYGTMCGGTMYGENLGEVDFSLIGKEKSPKSDMGIYSVLTGKKEEERSLVAEEVVRLIEEEHGTLFFDADAKPSDDPNAKAGMMRPVEYGDIAVLVRTNEGEASAIVRLLSERGIPVTSAAKVNICSYFEVRLILDWLSYLDNAEQDIPMATAMLSAVGGFDERELAHIRLAAKSSRISFREACAAYVQKGDALAKKLQLFYEKVQQLRALSRVKTAQEMISHLLGLGLEAQIAAKGEAAHRLARVGRLIAESASCSDIHALLKRVRATENQLNFTESSGEDAVRVVTMHSSKGLEFPVVILAELDGAFRSPFRDEILWTDQFRIAPKCFLEADGEKISDSTILRDAAGLCLKREAIDGEINLLYVAMTRAKYRLHVVLEAKSAREIPEGEQDLQFSPQDASQLSAFIPLDRLQKIGVAVRPAKGLQRSSVEGDGVPASEAERSSGENPKAPDSVPVFHEELVQKILSLWGEYPHAESTQFPVKSSATELMRSHERAPVAHREGAAAAAFTTDEGIAYHAFLEHAVFGDSAEDNLARMMREGALAEAAFSLLDPERLKNILSMPCLCGLAGKKLYREQEFLLCLPACEMMDTAETDEIVFQGVIDLLIEEDGKYSIVDYKLSAHDDEEIRATYAPQIKLYRKAVARVKGVREEDIPARILNIARCREIEM